MGSARKCGWMTEREIVLKETSIEGVRDGHFSHIFVVKNVMFVWKYENKQKEAGDDPLKN